MEKKKIPSAEMDSGAWEVDCGISFVACVPNLTVTGKSSAFRSGPAERDTPMPGTNLSKSDKQAEHHPPSGERPPHAGLGAGCFLRRQAGCPLLPELTEPAGTAVFPSQLSRRPMPVLEALPAHRLEQSPWSALCSCVQMRTVDKHTPEPLLP